MFTIIGYFKEYIVDGKYYCTEPIDAPDREVMGYLGRREEVIEEDKKIGKKKLKKGQAVITMCYPLNGKIQINHV